MSARLKPQFVVDAEGNPTSVIISLKEYERLKAATQRSLKRERLLTELREALLEVSSFQKSGKRPLTLREFAQTI